MPLTIPSHQGLIAPLWRRWPHVFDAPALFVGAAMPDLVDGVISVFCGYAGQGLGHSLLGLILFGVPGGLLLWALMHAVARHLSPTRRTNVLARAWDTALGATRSGLQPADLVRCWGSVLACLGIGAFSHLCIDLISHGGFPWLLPWVPKLKIYPRWWYTVFARIPVLWDPKPHLITPHFLVWLFLSGLGVWMLFRPAIFGAEARFSSDEARADPP